MVIMGCRCAGHNTRGSRPKHAPVALCLSILVLPSLGVFALTNITPPETFTADGSIFSNVRSAAGDQATTPESTTLLSSGPTLRATTQVLTRTSLSVTTPSPPAEVTTEERPREIPNTASTMATQLTTATLPTVATQLTMATQPTTATLPTVATQLAMATQLTMANQPTAATQPTTATKVTMATKVTKAAQITTNLLTTTEGTSPTDLPTTGFDGSREDIDGDSEDGGDDGQTNLNKDTDNDADGGDQVTGMGVAFTTDFDDFPGMASVTFSPGQDTDQDARTYFTGREETPKTVSPQPTDAVQAQTTSSSDQTSVTSTFSVPTDANTTKNVCKISRPLVTETKCGLSCNITDYCHQGVLTTVRCQATWMIVGCFHRCAVNVTTCCHGYSGDDCQESKQACPVENGQTCSGHGACQTENSTCLCEQGFKGIACEICEDGRYGQDCSKVCTCVHGQCNSGSSGDGLCSCDNGFRGVNCDEPILKCEDLECYKKNSSSWRCIEYNGAAVCDCGIGYTFDPITTGCKAVNKCEGGSNPCGNNSLCTVTGPGKFSCVCPENFTGDGFICRPIDPCQKDNGGCEVTTYCRFTGPNQHACVCNVGFTDYVPGEGCKLINMCTPAKCPKNSDCETYAPFSFRCVCRPGYLRVGSSCNGNILERLIDINENNSRLKKDLDYAIAMIKSFYWKALETQGPFTIFIPTDKAFRAINKANNGFNNFLQSKDRARQILRQHILIGKFRLEDLQDFDKFYTLQGNAAEMNIRVARNTFKYKLEGSSAKAKVILRNFEANNGMIHFVNGILTLRPPIAGDTNKSALELIRQEPAYNRFEMLINASGMAEEFNKENITIFAPENKAWESLPAGTLDYLMEDEISGRTKLTAILRNHIVPGYVDVTDLIQNHMFKSQQGVNIMVNITRLGQIQLDGQVNVTQVDIPCSKGVYYYHIQGLLIPEYLGQIAPSVCDDEMEKKVKGPCSLCQLDVPCAQSSDTPTTEVERCLFWVRRRGRSLLGCSKTCLRKIKVPKCCKGFYGSQCLPCPGGFRNPCSGRGECLDTISGTGVCVCQANITGTACEKCKHSKTFGPDCNQTCTCLYGTCDDGPNGTGKCKGGSCQEGYAGDDCNKKLLACGRGIILCHAHANCYISDDNSYKCLCGPGYVGDGEDCKEANPCDDNNGGCHSQATCVKLGPGTHRCDCNEGWMGDGFACIAKVACTNHTDCHANASCHDLSLGKYHCICNVGFRGNGSYCELVNLCLENNGGCFPKAICTPLTFGERSCTCPEDMAGDGTRCFGTIFNEIISHSNLTKLSSLLKRINLNNNILDDANENLTLFAPSDMAMESFLTSFNTWNTSSYFEKEENVMTFFNFHTVYSGLTSKDFQSMSDITKRYQTLYDGFSVRIVKAKEGLHLFANHSSFAIFLQPDIAAVNGYIHIIDKVLEPFFPESNAPSLEDTLSSREDVQLFYQALNDTKLLAQLNKLDEYTVFVPSNDVMKSLNIKSASYLKYYIVPKLIFTPSVQDDDWTETLLGNRYQLKFTVSGDMVLVNGVKIVQSDILFDGGVLHIIAGLLQHNLSRCDQSSEQTEKSSCGQCSDVVKTVTCPVGFVPIIPYQIVQYQCDLPGSTTKGCMLICYKNNTNVQCCGGYYGPSCVDCPGGAENPCYGRGQCFDGIRGNGTCACEPGFMGQDCGQCENSNFVTPFCNANFNGCGYMNGNCSRFADCTEIESSVSCQCHKGYFGDGKTCYSLCDSLPGGPCHVNATCQLNEKNPTVKCECLQGYHGNGTWCTKVVNPCTVNNGGCDKERAICSISLPKTTDLFPGVPKCVCNNGYVGNGSLCSKDFLDAVVRIPGLRYFYSWLMTDAAFNSTYLNLVNVTNGNKSTFFAPISEDWRSLNFSSLIVIGQAITLTPVGNYTNSTKDWSVTTASGQVVNITTDEMGQFFANDIPIVDPNIETLSGILHLTAVPITHYMHIKGEASTGRVKSNTSAIIALVVVALVVGLLVVTGVIIYRKKYYEGFFKIFKKSKQGSDSNLSFARLSAQEDDDISLKDADTANYENPIYNDPDVM